MNEKDKAPEGYFKYTYPESVELKTNTSINVLGTPVITDTGLIETPEPVSFGSIFDDFPNFIDYKFNEDVLLDEIKAYIDKTYSAHYSQTKLQAFEEIVDNGYGLGFAMGNVTKYNKRFGRKSGKNRDDLLKQIHYAILALYAHDYESGKE